MDEARERLRGTVARGYCHEKNAHKELDGDLLEAIVDELLVAHVVQPVPAEASQPAPEIDFGTAEEVIAGLDRINAHNAEVAAMNVDMLIRCHDCGGTLIYKETAEGYEVFHSCHAGAQVREMVAATPAKPTPGEDAWLDEVAQITMLYHASFRDKMRMFLRAYRANLLSQPPPARDSPPDSMTRRSLPSVSTERGVQEKLQRYGRHDAKCPAQGRGGCTCGFAAALAAAAQPTDKSGEGWVSHRGHIGEPTDKEAKAG
jgi:hypothetical protein